MKFVIAIVALVAAASAVELDPLVTKEVGAIYL